MRVLTREAAAGLSGAEREAEKTLELCAGDVPPAYADACSSDLRLVRGLLAAVSLTERGLPLGKALEMGIINKSFDDFERQLVQDMIAARIDGGLTAADIFDR